MTDRVMAEDAMAPRSRLTALEAWWPREAADAVRLSAAVVAAIWLSMRFEFAAPHWAGWTVLSVTLATRAASLRKSLWRGGSTLVGVAIAVALMANFAQQTLAFDIAVALWIALLTAASTIEAGQRAYGFALAGFTVPIVAFSTVERPTDVFSLGVDRCSTILLGIVCAYAANVPIAPGTAAVGRSLADRLDTAADAAAAWLQAARHAGTDPGPLPSALLVDLSEAVVDSFTEQPSLRSGGGAILSAAPRLRRVLAAGLLRARLPERGGARATTLLGDRDAHADRQINRVRVAARLVRQGRRLGRRRAILHPAVLLWNDTDWDGRHARDNAVRAFATVSIVNAFWYGSGWTFGADAATWSALLAVLLASRADPVAEARAFTLGVPLAVVVGLVTRYLILTMTGSFALLAAVLLPLCMLAVIGRSDKRAIYGVGYGFLILGVVDPTNVMTYDLSASLNQALAQLLGMGFAIVAFAALPPPAGAALRRDRAKRRLLRSVHAAACDPAFLLPPKDRWLARGFGRLALITDDITARRSAQALLLIGLQVLVLRRDDDMSGRDLGRRVWSAITAGSVDGRRQAIEALRTAATTTGVDGVRGERIAAIAALVAQLDLAVWPGMPRVPRFHAA